MTEQEFSDKMLSVGFAADEMRAKADRIDILIESAAQCNDAGFTAAAEGLLEKAERLLNGSETAKA